MVYLKLAVQISDQSGRQLLVANSIWYQFSSQLRFGHKTYYIF